MRRLTKLFHCGDSQALEMFVGMYLIAAGLHRVTVLEREILGGLLMPFAYLTIFTGILQMVAAGHGGMRLRHVACAVSFFSFLCLGLSYEGILVGAASAWAWYRTLLDDKLERAR